ICLDFGGNSGRRAAAEMCFDFETVKHGRIVAGCDHHTANEFPAPYFERDVGRRVWPIQHHDPKGICRGNFSSRPGEGLRLKAHIETNKDRAFQLAFDSLEIVCRGLGGHTNVFKGERVRDDGTPAVGSKFDGGPHNEEKSVSTVLSPSTTPGRNLAER